MITEDYVSDEIFKLLKEKGFDDSCCRFVIESDGTYHRGAPTLQMAKKWLKEVHNIVVEPFMREDTKYVWYVHRIEVKFNKKYLIFSWGSKNVKYEQYEEACEAAIKYCLENLI